MIDWHAKAAELKRVADELELWAPKLEGAGRLALGRAADELRDLAQQIEALLDEREERATRSEPIPGWLAEALADLPAPPGVDEYAGEGWNKAEGWGPGTWDDEGWEEADEEEADL